MSKLKAGKPGTKICPKCNTPCASRLRTCSCGYQFPLKSAGKTKTSSNGVDYRKLALEFAFLECKGIDSAIKQVQEYKQNAVGEFIAAFNGDAVSAINELQKLKEKK